MSSTNKTANYNLSQFIGTDVPGWLSDYNSDMSKIDAGIHSAKGTADSAAAQATQSANDITTINGTLSTQAAQISAAAQSASAAQTTANEADTKADSLDQRVTTLENRPVEIKTMFDVTPPTVNSWKDFTLPTGMNLSNITILGFYITMPSGNVINGVLDSVYGGIVVNEAENKIQIYIPTGSSAIGKTIGILYIEN